MAGAWKLLRSWKPGPPDPVPQDPPGPGDRRSKLWPGAGASHLPALCPLGTGRQLASERTDGPCPGRDWTGLDPALRAGQQAVKQGWFRPLFKP
eukprot:NODE_7693_length_553_cov_3.748016_g6661_i0.p2 GENE.NODE_7693_length_553_cov_3.748016_g6661_i0~~NODE_7693_length_553_cov_3.748016_g6661_i0.p2  ORF type:complete len:94 (+),score=0.41 NODE_7693_length_553_cov_3.748016_g6661_i0:253-534(+)